MVWSHELNKVVQCNTFAPPIRTPMNTWWWCCREWGKMKVCVTNVIIRFFITPKNIFQPTKSRIIFIDPSLSEVGINQSSPIGTQSWLGYRPFDWLDKLTTYSDSLAPKTCIRILYEIVIFENKGRFLYLGLRTWEFDFVIKIGFWRYRSRIKFE